MASPLGHAYAGFMLTQIAGKKTEKFKFAIAGAMAALLPDGDIIGLRHGVPYDSLFGHRGFSHSISLALIAGFLIALVGFWNAKLFSRRWWYLVLFFFIATLSHGIIDGMTTGGLGIAYFAPFSAKRYFLPWRVIEVSPLNVSNLLAKYGGNVLGSEALWIGLPLLTFWGVVTYVRKQREKV